MIEKATRVATALAITIFFHATNIKAEWRYLPDPSQHGYKYIIDIRNLSFHEYELMRYQFFTGRTPVDKVDTGNPFNDKREYEERLEHFRAESNEKYLGASKDNTLFYLFSVPVTIGGYDFKTKTFEACLPGGWKLGDNTEFRMYGDSRGIFPCAYNTRINILGEVDQRPLDGAYSTNKLLIRFNSDEGAETVFNFSQGRDIFAHILCAYPDVSRTVFGCDIHYVELVDASNTFLVLRRKQGVMETEIKLP